VASGRVFLNGDGSLAVQVGYATTRMNADEARDLIAKLQRAIAQTGGGSSSVPRNDASAPVQLQHAASVLSALEPRLSRLAPLARRWHEANIAMRLQHAGRQFDQRTIAKTADLAEHRHGTAYFRAGVDAGLGQYRQGHFYYNGERYAIHPPGTPLAADDATPAVAQNALL
jgi:hypothetical protein